MKKWIALSIVFFILFLAACSGSDVSNESNGSSNDGNNSGKSDDEGITLRVMDWNDSTREFREEFHKQFMEKYPQVTDIEYTTLTQDQFRDTILAAVRTGEAPDLFPPPIGYELATLVDEGWYQPLNPYVEDEFFESFSDGLLAEGITTVDGMVYAPPFNPPTITAFVFYNKDLFRQAGLDPEQPPTTYSEFREYARKITEAGNGQFYGIIEGGRQTNRFQFLAQEWSGLSGSGLSQSSPVSLMNGEAPFHTEAVLSIADLLAGLADDGSFHPQTSGISAPEARELFANGEAGFIVQGVWNVGLWNTNKPELDYGVMAPPLPDNVERKGGIIANVGPGLGISKDSEHPEEAALYLKEFYGGGYYQEEVVKNEYGFSVVAGVTEEHAEGKLLEYYQFQETNGVIGPNPSVNPEVQKVYAEYKDVTPSLGEILQGIAVAGLRDYESMLQELSERTDANLADAIKAAQDKGADVSIDDFKYPEWDPMSHYSE